MLLSTKGKVVTHMKYCINCKHYYLQPEARDKTNLGRCLVQSVISPVDGKPTPPDQLEFCSVMRLPTNMICGLNAVLYSPILKIEGK